MRLLLIPGEKTNLLHDKRQAYRYYGILLLLTEWIQVECLYISLEVGREGGFFKNIVDHAFQLPNSNWSWHCGASIF